ncbi:MAG: hypothetical protein G01um101431_895 [Parcubacteria group bacterium Gr01-1014_31]|nr:MAG: hypothetical protein G01um101431_895 [Parcubacteria group bacterium Gr01-1014_31]
MVSVVWRAGFLSALCWGCAAPGTPPFTAAPWALPHGTVREVVVDHVHVGSREVGARLAAAVAAITDTNVCSTVRVVARNRQLLACATICAQTDHWRFADARDLLAGCLEGVQNWQTPVIMVSANEGGTDVLATAAFTPREGDRRADTCRCQVRSLGGTPLFICFEGMTPQEGDHLATRGMVLYHHRARQSAEKAGAH